MLWGETVIDRYNLDATDKRDGYSLDQCAAAGPPHPGATMNIDQDSIGIALGHALNRNDDIDRYTAHHPALFARGIEGAHFSQAFVIIAPKIRVRCASNLIHF